jgi:hypothetical protein
MRGTWQTTEGGGLGDTVDAIVVVLVVVAVAGPVLGAVAAAVAELVHVLLIAAAVIVGVGAAGLGGLLAWRWRRTRPDAARAMPPLSPRVARAAQPLPAPPPAIERAPEIHLHLHGVNAEDVAAIIARHEDGPA